MRHRLVPVLALAVSVVVAVAAAPAQASFPGANGKLAFAPLFGMEENSIGTLRPDGTFETISTGPVRTPANIAWSHDGKKLAFDGPATRLGSGRALYIMNGDGRDLRQVGRGDRLRSNPAWSPDGTKLAFVQDDGAGSGDIYTITTTGSQLRRLTTSSAPDAAPDWSADGTRIAYQCWSGGRSQVCQMAPSGASKSVTTGPFGLSGIADPTWSPSSAAIAFSADGQIFRISRSGRSLRQLSSVDGARPAWSPDGSRLAYEQYTSGGGFAIATMSAAEGSDSRWLSASEERWSVDPGGWQPRP